MCPGAGGGLVLTLAEPKTFPVVQILIRNRATDLDARMHDGTTPLILAARLAVEGMLEDLINSHADVNAVDDLGESSWASPREGHVTAACPPLTRLPTPDPPADLGPACRPLTRPLLPLQASPPCTGQPR